jgi:ATP-dependent metalloprotease
MVTQLPEKDELSLTRAQLLARMDVAMGGRVAEELVFGHDNITTGAASDFQQATAIARAMVTQYGMSEKLGPLSIDDIEAVSPSVRDIVDAEVNALLAASYQRAARVLKEHRRDLELLAKSLLEYETLARHEIDEILNSRRTGPLDHLL